MRISLLTGPELHRVLPDLARLRIQAFRHFPYLYDSSLDYEQGYLTSLTESKQSVIVAAETNGQIVGCATGFGLAGRNEELAAPFRTRHFDPSEIFYCEESVLIPIYRGRGLGHRFFDFGESHAMAQGCRYSAFCAVMRPADHPLKPANYSPLDAFWTKRGYRKAE